MKPPAASPGRAEKPQLPAPAPPGLARLLLSKSRRGGRSRRAPATSPMFVSRGRSRAADGEPSSPKVTCIGQVRMRKGKKGKKGAAAAAKAAAPEKGAKGYCRCLKKAFLCGGLFDFDSRKRRQKAPSPEVERARRSPWVFSSRDVAVAAVPKAADPRSGSQGEGHEDDDDEEMVVGVGVFGSIGREEGEKMGIGSGCGSEKEEEDGDDEREAQLVSSATTTPPKNALLLMRCRSAPQNRTSPLTSRFPAAPQAPVPAPVPSPSPTRDALTAVALEIAASPSPSPSPRKPERASPSPRKPSAEKAFADEDGVEKGRGGAAAAQEQDPHLIGAREEDDEEEEDDDEFEEEDEMRCSSARPLVLQRCKSEPATTAAAKMAAGAPGADATTAGCFWAHGGSSGRRRHAPSASGAPVALTGH